MVAQPLRRVGRRIAKKPSSSTLSTQAIRRAPASIRSATARTRPKSSFWYNRLLEVGNQTIEPAETIQPG